MKIIGKTAIVFLAMTSAAGAQGYYSHPVQTLAVPSGVAVDNRGNRIQVYSYQTYVGPSRAQIEMDMAVQSYREGYRSCYGCGQ